MKIKFQSFTLMLKRSLMMKLQKTFVSENRSSENFSLETQTAIRRNYVSCFERNSTKFYFTDTKPFAYQAFQEDFRFALNYAHWLLLHRNREILITFITIWDRFVVLSFFYDILNCWSWKPWKIRIPFAPRKAEHWGKYLIYCNWNCSHYANCLWHWGSHF